jgi:putative intracellular protease/amidase
VYERRPKSCRAFRCGALAGLEDGTMSRAEAEATLAEVRARREVVAMLVAAPTAGASVVAARRLMKEGRATEEIADALNRLLRLVMLLSQEPRR